MELPTNHLTDAMSNVIQLEPHNELVQEPIEKIENEANLSLEEHLVIDQTTQTRQENLNASEFAPDRLPAWLHQFLDTTQMSGFSFIHKSESWMEAGFWVIIIIFSASVMAVSTYALVSDYIDNEIGAKVSTSFNTSIIIPPINVLVRRIGFSLSSDLNHTKRFYDHLLSKYCTKSEFLNIKMNIYDPHTLAVIEWLFKHMMHAENPQDIPRRLRSLSDPAGTLLKFAGKYNITIAELIEKYNREIFKLLQIHVEFSGRDGRNVHQVPSSTIIALPIFTGIIFRVFNEKNADFNLGSSERTLRIRILSYTNISPGYTPRVKLDWYDIMRSYQNMLEVNFSIHFGQTEEIWFEVVSHHKEIPKHSGNKISCSLKKTLAECQQDCRAEIIHRLCGCNPITPTITAKATKRKQLNSYNLCTPQRYTQCLVGFRGTEDQKCRQARCGDRDCHHWKYNFNSIKVSNMKNSHLATFIIRTKSFDYVKFEDYETYKMPQFVADFGGVLGMWFGVSFIGVLHMFVFCLKKLFSMCRLHRVQLVVAPMKVET